jgi:hypothetical protein
MFQSINFNIFKRGVETFLVGCKHAAPLSELWQGLETSHKIGGVKRNFGGVEHFIVRGVREILGGFNPPP